MQGCLTRREVARWFTMGLYELLHPWPESIPHSRNLAINSCSEARIPVCDPRFKLVQPHVLLDKPLPRGLRRSKNGISWLQTRSSPLLRHSIPTTLKHWCG